MPPAPSHSSLAATPRTVFCAASRTASRAASSAFAVAVVSLALSACTGAPPPAERQRLPDRPNIVFVLADDLGAHDVGFAGARFYETPNLDRMARDGMIFERAYTCGPNCAPTRACLISGMYTPRHHIYTPGRLSKGKLAFMRLLVPARQARAKVAFPPSRSSLDPAVVSFAEVLKRQGYATAHFGKWHVGPDAQGFDVTSSNGEPGTKRNHYGDIDVAEKLTDAGLSFIEEHKDRPFFLYLAHWDVHTPIRARAAVVRRFEEKLRRTGGGFNPTYAAMIEAVDRSVGRLRRKLDDLQLQNTLFIFSSDNGGLPRVTSNAPLHGGKGSLFEGGIRVPACMTWPGVIAPGSRSTTPITSVDFLPTFAELAGAPVPDRHAPGGHVPDRQLQGGQLPGGRLPGGQPVDGRSLVPVLRGDDAVLRERALFWFFPLYLSGGKGNKVLPIFGTERPYWRGVPSAAIVKGDWKLIRYFEDDSLKLFNVVQDVSERHDRSGQEKDRAAALRRELDAWLRSTRAPVPTRTNPAFGS